MPLDDARATSWMAGPHSSSKSSSRCVLDGVERSRGGQCVQFGAAHEAAGLVGLVELHGVDQLTGGAAPTLQVLLVVADRGAVGVQHQVAADQAGGVGQAVWVLRRCGEQQQPWCADAVGAQHYCAGRLETDVAVAVDPFRAGGAVRRRR